MVVEEHMVCVALNRMYCATYWFNPNILLHEKYYTGFPNDHPSGIEAGVNKKVIGKFKDECGGEQIIKFVGLRAKLYSYQMDEGKIEKKV